MDNDKTNKKGSVIMFKKSVFTKEQTAFMKGVGLGTGVMTLVYLGLGLKKTLHREQKINELLDNTEAVITAIGEKILLKRGDSHDNKQ